MRGVVFTGNRQLEIRKFPDQKVGLNQVLVSMKASGICGSDLHFLHTPESSEVIQGHEPAGVVVEIGAAVENLQIGDRVAVFHASGCGSCKHCLSGHIMQCPSRRAMAWHINGSHADYLLTEKQYCLPLPEQLDFADGAIIACAGGTAYAMVKKIDPLPGGMLVVFGAGPLGLCSMLVARAGGARVLVVDVKQERLDFARRHGAFHTVDAMVRDPIEAVVELTDGQGADKIIETSGSTKARNAAIHCAAVGGTIGILGMRNPENRIDLDPFIRKQLTIFGSYVFPNTLYPEIRDFLVERGLHFSEIVSRTFALEQAEDAYRLFEAGAVGKFMFVW